MQEIWDIVGDGFLPNPYDDAAWLIEHQESGHDMAEVIYLSLGETWNAAAAGLQEALAKVPRHSHGYMLTPYGLPALRRILLSYITTTHDLAPVAQAGRDYEVAVSQNGTRTAMFDFARLLLNDNPHGQPVTVCSSPGWDYAGVFGSLGYAVRHFGITPEDGFQPNEKEVEQLLRQARTATSGPIVVAVNAQHNPTGANWTPRAVRHIVRTAVDIHACVLIDDAYFALHDPRTTPTCALRVLLEELSAVPRQEHPRWLAVRSLGKQFHCNGWGIGAMTGAPETVAAMVTRLLPQRSYVSSVPLQAAMAAWLEDPASDDYLARQRMQYAAKRAAVADGLASRLGYPADAYFPGECSGYLVMRTPPGHADGSSQGYRRECLQRAGVLLGEADMTTPGQPTKAQHGYVRLFLGPPQNTLTSALDRLARAGLGWCAGPPATPPTATDASAAPGRNKQKDTRQ